MNPNRPINHNAWKPEAKQFVQPHEQYFDDINRPRDKNGFKIIPGQQMFKRDMRSVLRNIYLNQIVVKTMLMVPPTTEGQIITWGYSFFKKKYIYEDLSFVVGYKVGTPTTDPHDYYDDILQAITDRETKSIGKPAVSVKDGYVVINKDGSYIVQFYADFVYPYPRDTSRMDKIIAWLTLNGQSALAKIQQRTCGIPDSLQGLYVGQLKKGDKLNVWCAHTCGVDVMCGTAINIIETS